MSQNMTRKQIMLFVLTVILLSGTSIFNLLARYPGLQVVH